jgi:hypothetical protein
MDAPQLGLLVTAGLLAGGINSVAGGGSLVSFPALLAAGYPGVTANVTNTVALWPGYAGSVLGFRTELAGQRRRAVTFSVTSVVGAVVGCVLLLATPGRVFDALVPALVLAACALLAVQPWAARLVHGRAAAGTGWWHPVGLHGGLFVGGVYGAYFGAGLGVMLLGILGVFVPERLTRVNAVRSVLSLVINTVALLAFALFGPVRWEAVAVMAVASLVGGYFGARVARRLSPTVLRLVVVAFGVVVATILAVR